MTTTDKHPPLDPKRHSTNKRVKPLGENIFGTAVREADGAKRVKVGEDNTTSARTMSAGETINEGNARRQAEADARQAAAELRRSEAFAKQDNFLSEASKKLLEKGWRTKDEQKILTVLRKVNGNLT